MQYHLLISDYGSGNFCMKRYTGMSSAKSNQRPILERDFLKFSALKPLLEKNVENGHISCHISELWVHNI